MDSTSSERHHKKKKKKTTTEAKQPAQDVKMDYVPSRDGHARPFVTYFPTGFDPVGEADHGDAAAALSSMKAYQGADKLKAKQTQLVASTHGKVDFVGMNYAGEAAAWQPCSYALGVYDKEKCTLQLVPIAGEKVAYFSFRCAIAFRFAPDHHVLYLSRFLFNRVERLIRFRTSHVSSCLNSSLSLHIEQSVVNLFRHFKNVAIAEE